MIQVDDDLLREAGSADASAEGGCCTMWVHRLGALAFWLFRRKVLEQALSDPRLGEKPAATLGRFLESPRVPQGPGACNVLFVLDGSLRQAYSPLRESLILPLKWKQGLAHSPALPPGLRGMADQVQSDLGKAVQGKWGLHLSSEAGLSRHDLSGLSLACESGWAALASSLLLADVGGRPRRDVFASAAWRPGFGIFDVESIGEKVSVAREFGCRVFYAAASQADELALNPADGVDVRFLPIRGSDPRRALQGLLHELEYPPRASDGAPFEARCRYANGFTDRESREDYILENVRQEQAERIVRKNSRLRGGFEHVAIIMSSPSAALLSLLVLRPDRALIVHTARDASAFRKVKSRTPADCSVEPFEVKVDAYREIEERILGFLPEAAESVAVDITGGTSGMTGAATLAAGETNAAVFHIASEHAGYIHRVGTEDLLFVRGEPHPS